MNPRALSGSVASSTSRNSSRPNWHAAQHEMKLLMNWVRGAGSSNDTIRHVHSDDVVDDEDPLHRHRPDDDDDQVTQKVADRCKKPSPDKSALATLNLCLAALRANAPGAPVGLLCRREARELGHAPAGEVPRQPEVGPEERERDARDQRVLAEAHVALLLQQLVAAVVPPHAAACPVSI
ncbi:hypothetical protein ON010_g12196 [Phytophthora cinnamomi]|nr:hypothetical protein ON010_g12196 [Phytophthora cinnamomi]